MAQQETLYPTLARAVWPSEKASGMVRNVIIYVPGLLWLGGLFGWDKPILEWGLTPFILGDLTKLALAAAVLPLAWRWLGRPKPAD